MNTCTTRRVALTPLAVSMALALAACGGGNGDEAPIFQRGEVVTFAATLADGSTEESHYLMHGVTADGDLVAQDEGLAKLAPKRQPLAGVLVALPLEQGGGSAGLAALRDFYKQLWQGIAEHRSDGSDIAAEIGAYETDVGTLYDDYRRSGFSTVKDYVVFYEQVGENPFFSAQETVEQDLVFFFYRTGWAQDEWLRALQRQNLDWPRFLKLMAERQDTFADLMYEYFVWSEAGGTGMDAFIATMPGCPSRRRRALRKPRAPRSSSSPTNRGASGSTRASNRRWPSCRARTPTSPTTTAWARKRTSAPPG